MSKFTIIDGFYIKPCGEFEVKYDQEFIRRSWPTSFEEKESIMAYPPRKCGVQHVELYYLTYGGSIPYWQVRNRIHKMGYKVADVYMLQAFTQEYGGSERLFALGSRYRHACPCCRYAVPWHDYNPHNRVVTSVNFVSEYRKCYSSWLSEGHDKFLAYR